MEQFFTITKVSPAIKNSNRVNIYINDEYSFSLTLPQVVDYKIKIGKSISSEELGLLKSASEYGKLYQSTLEWVLSRPRSIKEVRDHLHQKNHKRKFAQKINNASSKTKYGSPFPDSFIEQIINELIQKKYLDDKRFIQFYLENRKIKTGASFKKLRTELLKKGISQDLIQDNITVFRDELEEIKKIIAKKSQKYDNQKLKQYLLHQGFDFELVDSVLGTDL